MKVTHYYLFCVQVYFYTHFLLVADAFFFLCFQCSIQCLGKTASKTGQPHFDHKSHASQRLVFAGKIRPPCVKMGQLQTVTSQPEAAFSLNLQQRENPLPTVVVSAKSRVVSQKRGAETHCLKRCRGGKSAAVVMANWARGPARTGSSCVRTVFFSVLHWNHVLVFVERSCTLV